jgi:hypothetical protein
LGLRLVLERGEADFSHVHEKFFITANDAECRMQNAECRIQILETYLPTFAALNFSDAARVRRVRALYRVAIVSVSDKCSFVCAGEVFSAREGAAASIASRLVFVLRSSLYCTRERFSHTANDAGACRSWRAQKIHK